MTLSSCVFDSDPLVCCEEMMIGPSVTEIRSSTFAHCPSIQTLNFSTNSALKKIGSFAFAAKELRGIIRIPSSLLKIKDSAFEFCSQLEILDFSLALNLMSIGERAFHGCPSMEVQEFSSASNVKTIGAGAFSNCRLKGCISFHPKLVSIDRGAFGYTNIEALDFRNAISLVLVGGFECCRSLSGTVILPRAVEQIGKFAFAQCTNLERIDFANCPHLCSVSMSAFYGDANLKEFTCNEGSEPIRFRAKAFASCPALCSLCCHIDSTFAENTFDDTTNLTTVYLHDYPHSRPTNTSSAIDFLDAQTFAHKLTVKVPEGCVFDVTKLTIVEYEFRATQCDQEWDDEPLFIYSPSDQKYYEENWLIDSQNGLEWDDEPLFIYSPSDQKYYEENWLIDSQNGLEWDEETWQSLDDADYFQLLR